MPLISEAGSTCSITIWYNHMHQTYPTSVYFNTLRPRRNEQHFADDILKRIFFNENVWISIKISLKFVPKGPINNITALVQIMAWCRSGDKPLSEPMVVSLPTHICVTRPKWVNRHVLITLKKNISICRILVTRTRYRYLQGRWLDIEILFSE